MKAFIGIAVVFIVLLAVLRVFRASEAPPAPKAPEASQASSAPQSAYAGLRVCNKTSSRVSAAIGYKDPNKGWITEGWWTMMPGNCETVRAGPLRAKFYYVYAIDGDRQGEWGGHAFMCTQDKMFTIEGAEDCEKRGFKKSGFFEIDTGELQTWVVQLDESGRMGQRK